MDDKQKKIIGGAVAAIGVVVLLAIVLIIGIQNDKQPSNSNQNTGVVQGDDTQQSTAGTEEPSEATKGISLGYQAVTKGDVLEYTLLDYKKGDVVSTKWSVGGEVVSEDDGVSTYTVKEADEEKVILAEVKMQDGEVYTSYVYYSTIPVIYIDGEISYNGYIGTVMDYMPISMYLASNDYETEQLYSGTANLKLRGNSTANLAKKPFRLKLDTASDLLGMGSSKHWVLLANAIDSTNMRNKLILDFAGAIGAETYMQSELVSMVYNGEYVGVYQLCEQIRVDETRVDIYDWEDTAKLVSDNLLKALEDLRVLTYEQRKEIEDAVEEELQSDYSWVTSEEHEFSSKTLNSMSLDLQKTISLSDYMDWNALDIPEITGGVLLEMDFYEGGNAALLTNYKQPLYYNTPERGNLFPELHTYMASYIQSLEYALHDTDFIYDNSDIHYMNVGEGRYSRSSQRRKDVKYQKSQSFSSDFSGMHYSELLDMDSAVVNFLVCEFSRNWDCMKNSVFMYKDIEGTLKICPAWDFDWAWGNSMYNINTNFPTGWQTTDEYFANEQYYQSVQWNRYLVRDPYFLQRVYEKYHEIRETVIEEMIKNGGLIDTYYQKYANASKANDNRWGGSAGTYAGAKYDAEVERMKEFILERVEWLDEQFASLDTLIESIDYYVITDTIQVESVDTQSKAGVSVITATTTNEKATHISFQINGTYVKVVEVTNGKAVLEVPDSELVSEDGKSNVVQVREMSSESSYITVEEGTTYGDYTNAASNYAVFQ